MSGDSEKTNLLAQSFAALGIVFGDVGTSPLYAFFQAVSHVPLTQPNIYGVLSLIFWSLILIICVKYLLIVFRADNDGEGGVMALAGIIKQKIKNPDGWLLLTTFFGVGLIIGDGMLTPAISILSAVEGIKPLSPDLEQYIIPITIIILLFLFWMQKIGTGKIGILFAPVMLLWFITIGTLGLVQIIQNPNVLTAINPYYGFNFFVEQKQMAILTLGGVFLVMTGGEALFADLGHFGKSSIRMAWFCVALPGLLLCYFGQGAQLIAHPEHLNSVFYSLSPRWFLPFMIILATAATIIASQAIISAAFSILKQTSLLNLVPRLKVIYTSNVKGQVYLPFINFILLIGTCTLVLTFKTSDNLACAFGIAVNLDMIITTLLVAFIAYKIWKWNYIFLGVFPIILIVECAFLAGNIPKFMSGGWVPILITCIGIFIMYTWYVGFEKLRELNHRDTLFNSLIFEELNQLKIPKEKGVALFITDPYDYCGGSLLYHLRIAKLFFETMIFLSIKVESKPRIPLENKFEIIKQAEGVYLLNVHYGFTEAINLPNDLDNMLHVVKVPFDLDKNKLKYFIEIVSLELSSKKDKKMWYWQKFMFNKMLQNAVPDIQFYCLPSKKTISIGAYYEL